jgi:hypothetical protein
MIVAIIGLGRRYDSLLVDKNSCIIQSKKDFKTGASHPRLGENQGPNLDLDKVVPVSETPSAAGRFAFLG